MKTIIWLEDNPDSYEDDIDDIKRKHPHLKIEVWDGNYENSNNRGKKCLESFKNKIYKAIQKEDDIVAFILDLRIPVTDLSDLGLPNIETDNGLITGVQIARYYLRNEENTSPFKNRFKETPILFFTVSGITEEFNFLLPSNNYFYIDKNNYNKIEEILSELY